MGPGKISVLSPLLPIVYIFTEEKSEIKISVHQDQGGKQLNWEKGSAHGGRHALASGRT